MEFESNTEVWVTNDDALIEELVDAVGGLMGVLGGIGIFGCGICSLILGGVLALALKEPGQSATIVSNHVPVQPPPPIA